MGHRVGGVGSAGGMGMLRIVGRLRSRLLAVNRRMNTMFGSEVLTDDTRDVTSDTAGTVKKLVSTL